VLLKFILDFEESSSQAQEDPPGQLLSSRETTAHSIALDAAGSVQLPQQEPQPTAEPKKVSQNTAEVISSTMMDAETCVNEHPETSGEAGSDQKSNQPPKIMTKPSGAQHVAKDQTLESCDTGGNTSMRPRSGTATKYRQESDLIRSSRLVSTLQRPPPPRIVGQKLPLEQLTAAPDIQPPHPAACKPPLMQSMGMSQPPESVDSPKSPAIFKATQTLAGPPPPSQLSAIAPPPQSLRSQPQPASRIKNGEVSAAIAPFKQRLEFFKVFVFII
jgi:hypothetical protein